MQTLSEGGDHVALDADRCTGCGVCVSTCPSGDLTLERRSDREPTRIPVDMRAAWREAVALQELNH
jgi:ferredoxin